jgi:hypothetical protein
MERDGKGFERRLTVMLCRARPARSMETTFASSIRSGGRSVSGARSECLASLRVSTESKSKSTPMARYAAGADDSKTAQARIMSPFLAQARSYEKIQYSQCDPLCKRTLPSPEKGTCYLARAFRKASHRRLVASMIAFRPAALSLRFFRGGAAFAAAPDSFLRLAHLFRWAAAMRARAAADILRCCLPAPASPFSAFVPWRRLRNSAICSSIRLFCSSKPSIAALRTSLVSFVGMSYSMY